MGARLIGAFSALIAGIVFTAAEARGADAPSALKRPPDVLDLSIEELLNVKVTSVSKHEEKASRAESAIYVITQEDIRRSGATHVAEALRMAPGVNVGKSNANKWSVGVRGFGGVFANKLLVLVDGRSVYNPLFSGVYWDAQDLMLENIERIEVIRGPGATMWGANAVNGVINIITKKASDTQGGLASALGGTETRTIDAVRYGGMALDKKLAWRIYAKYGDRDDSKILRSDDGMKDEWKDARGGFRADWLASRADKVTFQGDFYQGSYEQRTTTASLAPPFVERRTEDAHYSGGNLRGHWTHEISDTSQFNLQAYYDRTVRDEVFVRQAHNTGDIEFDHHFVLGNHDIVYGAGYRIISEDVRNTYAVRLSPNHDLRSLYSAFLQDEIRIKDRLRLTLGSKFEHNEFTGFEVQPSARMAWTPTEKHSVWAAVSRAVRTPNPSDASIHLAGAVTPGPGGVLTALELVPNHDMRSEDLVALELGWRAQLHKNFSVDAAGFYNLYNLSTAEALPPRLVTRPAPAHILVPVQLQTKATGESFGGEIAANWSVLKNWRLSANYSYLELVAHDDPASKAPTARNLERSIPRHQAHLRSYLMLPHHVELDMALYYVDEIPLANIAGYLRTDARVGWRPADNLELSLSGQNLFDNKHHEASFSIFEGSTETERNVYLKLTWKF